MLQPSDIERVDVARVLDLLGRGSLLALQVESWANQGLWVLSRSDEHYPERLRRRLKQLAPPILYGAGNPGLLAMGGLGIVGSRNVDEAGLEFTRTVAQRCVLDGIQVISGGARGVDEAAMKAALDSAGVVIGVLAHSLTKEALSGRYRGALRDERLALLSPYGPDSGFSVGNAMGRNKLIYALSAWTLVVSSDKGKGGTWSGATETLKNGWAPVLVRNVPGAPQGNVALLEEGAAPVLIGMLGRSDLSFTDALEQSWANRANNDLSTAPLFDLDTLAPEQSVETADPVPAAAPTVSITPDTFWSDIIWPVLQGLVERHGSVSRDSLSDQTGIKTSQAEAWIKRALEEDKLVRKTRPVRYVFPNGEQEFLIDDST